MIGTVDGTRQLSAAFAVNGRPLADIILGHANSETRRILGHARSETRRPCPREILQEPTDPYFYSVVHALVKLDTPSIQVISFLNGIDTKSLQCSQFPTTHGNPHGMIINNKSRNLIIITSTYSKSGRRADSQT
ncbi:hypothetical protein MJO28_001146 [Puccinia striiformis f. sp. tritici]|uniref:Uncharacterized protein n=2 Tax=Puccinia striiformis f. sp. tritici TaxID=168172 RepID=A0A0L0VB94_9BASI|nr:hypothetical protein Pst134EA_000096 [Puccinia striiformis f. sp. tritici]KAI9601756.1 hypothetical protein KEM48_000860 [Puccinia striiformis f. sp. tritici PST-130]KNE96545.1 hypothetical protein PSTG_10104 [Puccinia striiformis f. sp. tritici PST-78]KAH9473014.1 hypothetical protein Pst134EA_000096 [Puccinia striiformis f. sp. tritici]KAI7963052.1 hypothetical protein MJO28_001146 [Puccinia striiformis f. sp. tritici]KAI7966822.1 hypothetical protein MJO29_000099 [Puccinia striiformis f.